MEVEKAKEFAALSGRLKLKSANGKLKEHVVSLVKRWEDNEFPELRFKTPEPVKVFNTIKSAYDNFIIAAGGLVINGKGRLLVIFRNGKWDLPKGKIEDGESVRKGAAREVMEETGLTDIIITKEFTRTYHTYILNGKRVLKETAWFLMTCENDQTNPQMSEGITSIEWISKRNMKQISTNTFDNILLLLKAYFNNKT